MTTVKNLSGKAFAVAIVFMFAAAANAATVWTGPLVEFGKTGADSSNDEQNQDRITPLVWLTRDSSAGLFNIAQEGAFQRFMNVSPAGTMWAFQDLGGNVGVDVRAENWQDLNFSDWTMALGGQGQLRNNILERPGVVHLVDEDIYFDILFLEWTDNRSGANVRYVRTSPIPIPAAAWLMASALGLLGFMKRRLAA